MASLYPTQPAARNRWIVAQRHNVPRATLDPFRPYEFLCENERAANGEMVSVATIFLTNRECPWKCLMCDLWRNTLQESVPLGAIPAQIDYALQRLPNARQIKLYNSGSFFDNAAIPRADYAAIAARLQNFERVIVESHAKLVNEDCLHFARMLSGKLEVAIGLETVHPTVGPRLNKGATLDDFARAAEWLRAHEIDLRVFILLKPPFMDEDEAILWAKRSLDFAFDCGATVAAVIPTRAGNGALEALAANSEWSPPKLGSLENVLDYGIGLKRGRVFADLWDLGRFSTCENCFAARHSRLNWMNEAQQVLAPVFCAYCATL